MKFLVYLFVFLTLVLSVQAVDVFINDTFEPSLSNASYVFQEDVLNFDNISVDQYCLNATRLGFDYSYCKLFPILTQVNLTEANFTTPSNGNITNCYQLQDMNLNLSSNYQLLNDIDCTITKTWNGGLGFLPVGSFGNPMNGNINGNNFTVTNLFINNSGTNLRGFLGSAGANLTDIIFENFTMIGDSFSGLVATVEGDVVFDNIIMNSTFISCDAGTCAAMFGAPLSGTIIVNNTRITNLDIQAMGDNIAGIQGGTFGLSSLTVHNTVIQGRINSTASGIDNLAFVSGTINGQTFDFDNVNVTGTMTCVSFCNSIAAFAVNMDFGSITNSNSNVNITSLLTAGNSLYGFVENIGRVDLINITTKGNIVGLRTTSGFIGVIEGTLADPNVIENIIIDYTINTSEGQSAGFIAGTASGSDHNTIAIIDNVSTFVTFLGNQTNGGFGYKLVYNFSVNNTFTTVDPFFFNDGIGGVPLFPLFNRVLPENRTLNITIEVELPTGLTYTTSDSGIFVGSSLFLNITTTGLHNVSINTTVQEYNITVNITAIPRLELTLQAPLVNLSVGEGEIFNYSVKVTCKEADCGNVEIDLFANASLISNVPGTIPFDADLLNPFFIPILKDSSVILNYDITANANNGTYDFVTQANIVNVPTVINQSANIFITIVQPFNITVDAVGFDFVRFVWT